MTLIEYTKLKNKIMKIVEENACIDDQLFSALLDLHKEICDIYILNQ